MPCVWAFSAVSCRICVRCAAHGRVPAGPAGCFPQIPLPPSQSGSAFEAHSAQCYGVFHPADYGSCNCLCSVCCRSTDNRCTAFLYSWPTCAPVAAAVPTVEKACKQGHRFGIVRPACFGFQNPLHQFKLFCWNDCFMGIVHDCPVPHRHIHFLFGTIIQPPCLSLYQFPGIDLIVQDAVHCLGGPRRSSLLRKCRLSFAPLCSFRAAGDGTFSGIQTICDA